jgi:hypothetical protein
MIRVEVSGMGALIVVESSFGNTRAIAGAVADGLGQFMTVEVCDVVHAPMRIEWRVDLLVVGGPTHALGMSRPDTRRDTARQAGDAAGPGTGVREWLASGPTGIGRAAAFDTRIDKRWVPGSAARGIAKGLRRLGGDLVVAPETFWVTATPGPLATGELDRAYEWGVQLAAMLIVADSTRWSRPAAWSVTAPPHRLGVDSMR